MEGLISIPLLNTTSIVGYPKSSTMGIGVGSMDNKKGGGCGGCLLMRVSLFSLLHPSSDLNPLIPSAISFSGPDSLLSSALPSSLDWNDEWGGDLLGFFILSPALGGVISYEAIFALRGWFFLGFTYPTNGYSSIEFLDLPVSLFLSWRLVFGAGFFGVCLVVDFFFDGSTFGSISNCWSNPLVITKKKKKKEFGVSVVVTGHITTQGLSRTH